MQIDGIPKDDKNHDTKELCDGFSDIFSKEYIRKEQRERERRRDCLPNPRPAIRILGVVNGFIRQSGNIVDLFAVFDIRGLVGSDRVVRGGHVGRNGRGVVKT